jgi:uncharacterized membrane protein
MVEYGCFSGMMGGNYFGGIIQILVIMLLILFIVWMFQRINEPNSRRKR